MIIIKKEFFYINNFPEHENNIFHWTATMIGPKDTLYKNIFFTVNIYFPDDYPKHSPDIYFSTPIYHVNDNHKKSCENKAEKLMQQYILMLKLWKPEYKMMKVLANIFTLFYIVDQECAYEINVAKEIKENRTLYNKKIIYFTEKYANPNNIKAIYDQS